MTWHRCTLATGISTGLFFLVTSRCLAAELSWQPHLKLGTRGYDNVRWAADDEEAALGFDTGGGVSLTARDSRWSSAIDPAFNFRRFAIGENLDVDEYSVKSVHEVAVTERLRASLRADYIRDSTLTTEFADAGRQNDIANRDTVNVQPGITYALTDVTLLNAGYVYSDVTFDAEANQGLVNYTFEQWSAGVTHYFSPRLQGFSSLFVTDFAVPDAGGETWTYGGQAGLSYEWTDSLSTNASIGYQTSSIDFLERAVVLLPGPPPQLAIVLQPAHSNASGPIASFGMKKSFENTDAELNYARRVSPSIRGAQSQEDDIAVAVNHDVSKTLKVGFRGGYSMRSAQAEEIGGTSRNLNRNQVSLGATVLFRATREISVRSEYRFARNALADDQGNAYVNSLLISLIYNGTPRAFGGW